MDDARQIGMTQRLIEFFPEHAGIAARATNDWLKGIAPGLLGDQASLSLGRMGSLEVRLAQRKRDIKRAQKLRYKVFYKHGHAIADAATLLARRDKDAFDAICDHLLVIDHAAPPTMRGEQPVVGTYRLLPQRMADAHHGFYSENEFDLSGLRARHSDLRFLELGRSCVLPAYRTKRTVELLWQGIWAYVQRHRIDVMIGCASLEGTDPDRLAIPLSYLHHHARAQGAWHAAAQPARAVSMNRIAPDRLDQRAALRMLPPLIKGYLRVGALVGEGAVIDHQFGTTDVLIVMPVSQIAERYRSHFGRSN
jgi:putative hemolysin